MFFFFFFQWALLRMLRCTRLTTSWFTAARFRDSGSATRLAWSGTAERWVGCSPVTCEVPPVPPDPRSSTPGQRTRRHSSFPKASEPSLISSVVVLLYLNRAFLVKLFLSLISFFFRSNEIKMKPIIFFRS